MGEHINDSLTQASMEEMEQMACQADALCSPVVARRSRSTIRINQCTDEPMPGPSPSGLKRKSTGSTTGSVATKRVSLSDKAVQRICTRPSSSGLPVDHVDLASTDENGQSPSGASCDSLSFYGLPSQVRALIQKYRGISKLYPWQEACLEHRAIANGKSLIICLPTSGGKTLIAELLILRTILNTAKDALLILPYVSIVQEKVKGFTPLGLELGFMVEEYAGSRGRMPPVRHRRKQVLYVATIERAASLLNSLTDLGRLERLGLVVVDELHMVGDGSRGTTLELCLTRMKHCHPTCQIMGMSATLSNPKDLSKWLDADIFTQNFRPVQLTERVKVKDEIFDVKPGGEIVLSRRLTGPKSEQDADRLAELVQEVVPDGSCLVFCPSKKNAENVAKLLARFLYSKMKTVKTAEKKELLALLSRECDDKICPLLNRCIPAGIAYHHSGLTNHERNIIQDAYLDGTLQVICCTSTLAAGVNLPAQRVIIRSPLVGPEPMPSGQYKQMCGRAGRAGLDSEGESILILQEHEVSRFKDRFFNNGIPPVRSQLLTDKGVGMKNLVLAAISLGIAQTVEDLKQLCHETLLAVQSDDFGSVDDLLLRCIGELTSKKLIQQCTATSELKISQLGHAVVRGSLDLDIVSTVFRDLAMASNCLMLNGHLHLLYIVVPYDVEQTVQIDSRIFERRYECLNSNDRQLCQLLKITDMEVEKEVAYQGATKLAKSAIRRLGLAFVLQDLFAQKPLFDVAQFYQLPRGTVQHLLQSAAAFAGCLTRFCEDIPQFWALKRLLPDFAKQLTYCIHAELLPLMEIQGVRHSRAKLLFAAGYKSVAQIAKSDWRSLVRDVEHLPRSQALAMIRSAKMLVQEKMEALLDEADNLMHSTQAL